MEELCKIWNSSKGLERFACYWESGFVFISQTTPLASKLFAISLRSDGGNPFFAITRFLSDMRTALYRMGQRVDKLPFLWSRPVGPCFDRLPMAVGFPNKRTHGA